MAQAMQNLWPIEQVSVNVRSPLAILRTQAELVSQFTKGVLEGEIVTRRSDDKSRISHYFEIIAPALGSYRVRVFSVSQDGPDVYPATVTGLGLDINPMELLKGANPLGRRDRNNVFTEDDFIQILTKSLRSKEMIGLMQSLIARSNDEVKPVEA